MARRKTARPPIKVFEGGRWYRVPVGNKLAQPTRGLPKRIKEWHAALNERQKNKKLLH